MSEMGRQAAPTIRVYCDREHRDASGRSWHDRGPRQHGTYVRVTEPDGRAWWAEVPQVRAGTQRRIDQAQAETRRRHEDAEAAGLTGAAVWDHVGTDAGGPFDGSRWHRPATELLLHGDTPAENQHRVREAMRHGTRSTSTELRPADPEDMDGRGVYVWRCPCELTVTARHSTVWPIFDARATAGDERVRLADLEEWVTDTGVS